MGGHAGFVTSPAFGVVVLLVALALALMRRRARGGRPDHEADYGAHQFGRLTLPATEVSAPPVVHDASLGGATLSLPGITPFEVDLMARTVVLPSPVLQMGGVAVPLPSALLDRTQWRRLLHPQDQWGALKTINDAIHGASAGGEAPCRILVAPDTWRWALIRVAVQRADSGHAVLLKGVVIDMHDSHTSLIALDEHRRRLEAGPVVMVRIKVEGDVARFGHVSANAATLWGYEPGVLLSWPTSMFLVHPEDAASLHDELLRPSTAANVSATGVELRLRMADGRYRWHCYSGTREAGQGVQTGYFIDIDARKQAELEAATQRLRLQETILQLEVAHSESAVLQETSDMLHATEGMPEAMEILKMSAVRLFPGWSGWVAASQEGGSELVVGAQWGPLSSAMARSFNGRDCWGMRRGKPHAFVDPETGLCCGHLQAVPPHELRPYLCVPMAANGETVGALHLFCERHEPAAQEMQEVQQRASRFAETLKLALSNLRLRASLQDQAMKDGLTGLYNRRYMDEVLGHELQRADRDQRPVSLAMIDVDHFKQFNDQYGHDAGDHVLKAVADVVRASVRGYDIACRYGGEEMALILPACEPDAALARVEHIREAVAALRVTHADVELPAVTISAGVACALAGAPASLIRQADEALYAAKRAGRNRVVVAQAPG